MKRSIRTRLIDAPRIRNEHVDELRHAKRLPPLIAIEDGDRFYLLDGHHRLAAHELNGQDRVTCWVLATATRDVEARWRLTGKSRGVANLDKALLDFCRRILTADR